MQRSSSCKRPSPVRDCRARKASRRQAGYDARGGARSICAGRSQQLPNGRTDVQRCLADKLGPLVAVADAEVEAALGDPEKQQLAALDKQLTETQQAKPTADTYRMVALEDICWAILNTNEFLFQH